MCASVHTLECNIPPPPHPTPDLEKADRSDATIIRVRLPDLLVLDRWREKCSQCPCYRDKDVRRNIHEHVFFGVQKKVADVFAGSSIDLRTDSVPCSFCWFRSTFFEQRKTLSRYNTGVALLSNTVLIRSQQVSSSCFLYCLWEGTQ